MFEDIQRKYVELFAKLSKALKQLSCTLDGNVI